MVIQIKEEQRTIQHQIRLCDFCGVPTSQTNMYFGGSCYVCDADICGNCTRLRVRAVDGDGCEMTFCRDCYNTGRDSYFKRIIKGQKEATAIGSACDAQITEIEKQEQELYSTWKNDMEYDTTSHKIISVILDEQQVGSGGSTPREERRKKNGN